MRRSSRKIELSNVAGTNNKYLLSRSVYFPYAWTKANIFPLELTVMKKIAVWCVHCAWQSINYFQAKLSHLSGELWRINFRNANKNESNPHCVETIFYGNQLVTLTIISDFDAMTDFYFVDSWQWWWWCSSSSSPHLRMMRWYTDYYHLLSDAPICQH